MAKNNSIDPKSGDKHKQPDPGRRSFLKQSSLLTALAVAPPALVKAAASELDEKAASYFEQVPLSIGINGINHKLSIEPRVTLLDLLREQLALPGTKKGCDHGQCGACTVHVDGRRVLSCMSLAVMLEGKQVTTIEGLAPANQPATAQSSGGIAQQEAAGAGQQTAGLHPMQEAFIKHDGFQCGYCTPGQIMSGIACIREGHADSDDEIREYMSGNICRCGAYPNIVKAIAEVKKTGAKV
jgi:xanthine dehydrogenase YagT iron-sulfur-binding subunit